MTQLEKILGPEQSITTSETARLTTGEVLTLYTQIGSALQNLADNYRDLLSADAREADKILATMLSVARAIESKAERLKAGNR